jgi:hypothetical protein
MQRPSPRSLAYDLLETDLSSVTSLTQLVVAHTIAPIRAACGLPSPRPGEGTSFGEEVRTEGYITLVLPRPWTIEESSSVFDPIFRALLFFGWLFPESLPSPARPERLLDDPGGAVLSQSWALIPRSYDVIADLVAGLLGAPTMFARTYLHQPGPNATALAELEQARLLVTKSLDPVPMSEPVTQIIDIGLDRIGWWSARAIDHAVRADVHRRLIWFGTLEPTIEIDSEGEPRYNGPLIAHDRGVFAAQVPESLTGLVLLDLTEQLGLDRTVGRCGHCGRLMTISAWQSSRARRGDPIYHTDCRDEHRLIYFRRKAHDRYARTRGKQA